VNLDSILKRIKALEGEPRGEPEETSAIDDAARASRALVGRLDEHMAQIKAGTFVEGCDDVIYGGETIGEHVARVAALHQRAAEEIGGEPCEIDEHISELGMEVAYLEAALREES